MACRVLFPLITLASLGSLGLLAGCSPYQRQERPPWRTQAEEACLARGHVQESAAIRSARPIDGPGICGLTRPFKVTALAGGAVALNATATIDCSMIETLDSWLAEVVQPAAQARFGEAVVRINTLGSYSCRGINNMSGASLSEHSFGNAIDISGFVLASGRELNVMRGFNGSDEQERAFLHEAHAGACGFFTTVLGPGYNIFHYNHFHIDLAQHGSTSHGPRRYCKPVPEQSLPDAPRRDNLPDPPPIEEEMDIARAPIPAPELGRGGPNFVATAPLPAIEAYRPASAQGTIARPNASAAVRPPREPAPSAAPPIVTFAAVAQPSTARPQRRIAPEPDRDAVDGAPAPADPAPTDQADSADVAPPPEDIPASADGAPPAKDVSREAAPAEGNPNDWDLTSALNH